jgi:hypothetical protein
MATLIVCPGSIVTQWVQEYQEKLGTDEGIITIHTTQALRKLTYKDVQAANIVVVNRSVLNSESYTTRLAAFAGLPEPISTKKRAF